MMRWIGNNHIPTPFITKNEIILKKVGEKFGWFKKSVYLCTRKSESGGSVAQLNRASDYGSEGCGFESRRNHKDNRKRLQSQQLAIFLS